MKTILLMMALALPVMAQALIWEVDAPSILPAAESEQCVVRVDSSNRAWVILQNATTSKLIRVSSTGQTTVWTLPASEFAYELRSVGRSSCVVQAGANVTRVSLVRKRLSSNKMEEWKQTDAVIPEEAVNVKYAVLDEDGDANGFWYYVLGDDGRTVSKVVLRRNP